MRDFLGTRDWTTTGVIGEGEGGSRGLEGRRERVARNTRAGDETRRPKRADASGDAPAAGSEAAAMPTRRVRRVAIGKVDDVLDVGECGLWVVGEVVEQVVVVVGGGGREGMALACESEMAACLPFELDVWLCTL